MSHTATLPNPAITERAQQAIGQIAVELPGATAIFRRLKLDFCCGGQIPLSQACEQKQLDTAAVLEELARLDRPATQEAPQSPRRHDRPHPGALPRRAPRTAARADPHGAPRRSGAPRQPPRAQRPGRPPRSHGSRAAGPHGQRRDGAVPGVARKAHRAASACRSRSCATNTPAMANNSSA